ncbi:MAG: hypothetical protein R2911_05530 [Caldilineaceae bacterium]
MSTEMKKYPLKRLIFWTPRILGILFALFVSIFALDVFGAGYGFWGAIAAFLIHLAPVYVLLIGLAIAWRWPWVGALIFMGFAGWYLMQAWGRFPTSVYLVMAGIPFVVGVLWLLDWLYKPELRHSSG